MAPQASTDTSKSRDLCFELSSTGGYLSAFWKSRDKPAMSGINVDMTYIRQSCIRPEYMLSDH